MNDTAAVLSAARARHRPGPARPGQSRIDASRSFGNQTAPSPTTLCVVSSACRIYCHPCPARERRCFTWNMQEIAQAAAMFHVKHQKQPVSIPAHVSLSAEGPTSISNASTSSVESRKSKKEEKYRFIPPYPTPNLKKRIFRTTELEKTSANDSKAALKFLGVANRAAERGKRNGSHILFRRPAA